MFCLILLHLQILELENARYVDKKEYEHEIEQLKNNKIRNIMMISHEMNELRNIIKNSSTKQAVSWMDIWNTMVEKMGLGEV